ncbi:hypothetical protein MMC10_008549 [Thelotrema lepadinum]|nr:hypothetical protein [Thelotrema lepadinum]
MAPDTSTTFTIGETVYVDTKDGKPGERTAAKVEEIDNTTKRLKVSYFGQKGFFEYSFDNVTKK